MTRIWRTTKIFRRIQGGHYSDMRWSVRKSLLRCFKPRECLCHNNISRLAYDVSSSCRRQSLLFDCDRN
jgi:hypothetical protein